MLAKNIYIYNIYIYIYIYILYIYILVIYSSGHSEGHLRLPYVPLHCEHNSWQPVTSKVPPLRKDINFSAIASSHAFVPLGLGRQDSWPNKFKETEIHFRIWWTLNSCRIRPSRCLIPLPAHLNRYTEFQRYLLPMHFHPNWGRHFASPETIYIYIYIYIYMTAQFIQLSVERRISQYTT